MLVHIVEPQLLHRLVEIDLTFGHVFAVQHREYALPDGCHFGRRMAT